MLPLVEQAFVARFVRNYESGSDSDLKDDLYEAYKLEFGLTPEEFAEDKAAVKAFAREVIGRINRDEDEPLPPRWSREEIQQLDGYLLNNVKLSKYNLSKTLNQIANMQKVRRMYLGL